ncbi:MAG: hypothetical protein PHU34_06895 [Candidatus Methanoperedens sp.]|nr:hypothetical protein [Candidatus Methanoperedens sp.]
MTTVTLNADRGAEFALLKSPFFIGLLKSGEMIKFVDKLTEKKRIRPDEVAAEIELIKNEKKEL